MVRRGVAVFVYKHSATRCIPEKGATATGYAEGLMNQLSSVLGLMCLPVFLSAAPPPRAQDAARQCDLPPTAHRKPASKVAGSHQKGSNPRRSW